MKYIKQEAHEPLHSPEKFAKLWLYHNIDKERKKTSRISELNVSSITSTHG